MHCKKVRHSLLVPHEDSVRKTWNSLFDGLLRIVKLLLVVINICSGVDYKNIKINNKYLKSKFREYL